MQFRQRLEWSSQYLVAKIESAILKLKQNASSVKEAEVRFSISLAIGVFLISYLLCCCYVFLALKLNCSAFFQGILKSLECGNSFVGLSDEIKKKRPTFNEDFELRPWWTPMPDKNYLLG